MDLLLVLAIPVALALAALRWGADSRGGLLSEEELLARYGVVWEHTATPADARQDPALSSGPVSTRPPALATRPRHLVSG